MLSCFKHINDDDDNDDNVDKYSDDQDSDTDDIYIEMVKRDLVLRIAEYLTVNGLSSTRWRAKRSCARSCTWQIGCDSA